MILQVWIMKLCLTVKSKTIYNDLNNSKIKQKNFQLKFIWL